MKKTGIVFTGLSAALLLIALAGPLQAQDRQSKEFYKARDFSSLIGLKGFSETLLRNHFTLYEGYVKNTNILIWKLQQLLSEGSEGSVEFAELKRRLGWEFNGMRLHELYFENLGGTAALSQDSALYMKIVKDFGSFENWKKDFVATARMRGIGWVMLYYDSVSDRLLNMWIDEHALNHLSGAEPLLIIDVFEHAFLTDYGLNRAQYIDSFFNAVNWDIVTKRFK